MRSLLLALCACNQTFGINANFVGRDAQVFDVMADAQPLCPTVGTMPRFSPSIHQLFDRACVDYTIGGDRAMALCDSGQIEEAKLGDALAPAVGLPIANGTVQLRRVALAPEGDAAYVDVVDRTTGAVTHTAWRRNGTSWDPDGTVPAPGPGPLSTPTRVPRRLLYQDDTHTVIEMIQTGPTTWSQSPVDVGSLELVSRSWLSPDGLRAVLLSQGPASLHLLYIDRASIDDTFNAPKELPSLPSVDDLFITEDCTRAYMSSVQSVFYAAEI